LSNLLLILLLLSIGVALMVVLGERFAKPMDSASQQKLSRWLMPLVGFALVLSLIKYYW
jgi:hypothetical protein